eukprot:scaffold10724_cov112-Skeletonema_dohrnii-CCMP3373.AAC.8
MGEHQCCVNDKLSPMCRSALLDANWVYQSPTATSCGHFHTYATLMVMHGSRLLKKVRSEDC